MYGIYILRSKKDGSLYTGYASDVKSRVAEHNKGYVSSTRDKRPWELIYCELYNSRIDAMRREKYFKSGWGRNYIKKILKNTLDENDKK